MLLFHAHAGKQMPALSYTIIHFEHSLMLKASSLADFSLTQWELPVCWLHTADRRKKEAKKVLPSNKNIAVSPNCTKYEVCYVKKVFRLIFRSEYTVTTFGLTNKPTCEKSPL